MNERDIPSVPVTTLSGLTSLSDLLSELPVSGSLLNVTALNKSLLFHALVASESNNLLSVRDEDLVKQLVNAIEQTNSDNIDLKPEYTVQQPFTDICTYPELLQGIYKFKPTVFNESNVKKSYDWLLNNKVIQNDTFSCSKSYNKQNNSQESKEKGFTSFSETVVSNVI